MTVISVLRNFSTRTSWLTLDESYLVLVGIGWLCNHFTCPKGISRFGLSSFLENKAGPSKLSSDWYTCISFTYQMQFRPGHPPFEVHILFRLFDISQLNLQISSLNLAFVLFLSGSNHVSSFVRIVQRLSELLPFPFSEVRIYSCWVYQEGCFRRSHCLAWKARRQLSDRDICAGELRFRRVPRFSRWSGWVLCPTAGDCSRRCSVRLGPWKSNDNRLYFTTPGS